jgi:hypothetical protein
VTGQRDIPNLHSMKTLMLVFDPRELLIYWRSRLTSWESTVSKTVDCTRAIANREISMRFTVFDSILLILSVYYLLMASCVES